MAYQKLQVGRATDMDDKQSDTENTVNLNDVAKVGGYTRNSAGTATATIIQVSGADFPADGLQPGDLVVGTAGATRIISVQTNTLTLTTGVVPTNSAFEVLSQSEEPAVLYVGTAAAGATLKVRSAGGDDATFVNIQQGSFIPVQVKRVYDTGTTATNIVALF